ncbi:MAG: HAMP domain-containing histidine kinase [Bacteroidetes bacterium]|nr:HAMP domain-containing histidine kinase [Bacteroidota bacterium]
MIKISSRRKYRRLLLFYSLVIILPGTLLSILAYRGIQGNRIAELKIQDDRLVRKSRYFTGSIEESISTYLDAFSDGNLKGEGRFLTLKPDSVTQALLDEGVVLTAASWEPDGLLKLLDRTTLFVPDDFWTRTEPGSSIIQKLVDAQSKEIIHHDLPEALHGYNEVVSTAKDPLVTLQALSGLARIKREQNENDELRALFDRIRDICQQPELVSLMSCRSPAILKEISSQDLFIIPISGDNTKLYLDALEVFFFIGLPQIYLTESEYMILFRKAMQSYSNSVRENLSAPGQLWCDSLLTDIDKRIEINTTLSNLFTSIERNLTTDLNNKPRVKVTHIHSIQDTLTVLFSCRLKKNENVGLLFNTKELMKRNFGVLSDTISFPRRIAWQIRDNNDKEFAHSSDFDDDEKSLSLLMYEFGHWELKLQDTSTGFFALLGEAGQLVYFLVFIFIIAAMAVGLFLAMRSLTVEYRISHLKSDFVSTVSHEFKSPLTSIRMMSERLVNKRVKSDERKLEYYQSMLNQSERLSHLVENILDFSRLDEGRKTFHFEPCNLSDLIREVVEYLVMRNSDLDFEVTLDLGEEPIFAMVDSQGIHQVIYNLIDNAIKYSGNSRKVDVKLGIVEQTVRITVKDFGIGISKKERKRIFSRFYRSEGLSFGSITGSGIGLSIVSEIVKAHNGCIEMDSELGVGSTFSVYLPINRSKS